MFDILYFQPLLGAVGGSPHPMLTISLAIGAGILLTVIARRLNMPTIVLLLLGGLLLGPEGLNWVQPDTLGDILPLIVSMAIGIILFEGGLTLSLRDYAHANTMIRRLLSVGVLVTWFGGAITIWLIFDFPFPFALLAASLVIVTGPTVIVPILKRIKAVPRVANILHWEGVLIDAIGVFIAVLCFDWVVAGEGGQALVNFGIRVVAGVVMGVGGGWLIEKVLRRRWIPEEMTNIYVLASGILLFGLSETIIVESGLLAVTLAGLYLGWKEPLELREIRTFKAEITELMIGLLFILLVARLELEQFVSFGWPGLVAVGVMMFIVRPLAVLASSWGVEIPWREKAFFAWVAPRGIVAASLASLFALNLAEKETVIGDPAFLETFTYSMICATVVVQGFSSGFIGKMLGLRRPDPVGWLIVGANIFGRRIAKLIQDSTEIPVVIIDSNLRNVNKAKEEGFEAFHEDALDAESLLEKDEFQSIGHVLAVTDNVELNQLIQRQWRHHVGRFKVFGWKPVTPATPNNVGQASRGTAPTSAKQERTGAVFGNVARPSVVSGELERKEAAIDIIPVPVTESDEVVLPEGHPLFVIRENEITPLEADRFEEDQVRPGDQLIILHRSRGFLRRALQNGAFMEPEAEDLEALYKIVAKHATTLEPMLQQEVMLENLYEQQKAFPAFLGNGVAVPHVYSSIVKERMCLFARPTQALQFMGKEDQIRYVFFIISPSGDSEGHLGTLAEIARCCQQESNISALSTADSLDDILQVV
jgi:NhaP-type Na+/H+ or K+/H+ antiporter/mannitol/fructose-specific phosphotransferase system IIA component (Ntr-type)